MAQGRQGEWQGAGGIEGVHGKERQWEWQGTGGIEGVARGDNGSGRVQGELREWQGETMGVAGCRRN